MIEAKKSFYSCKVWFSATSLKTLKIWVLLLPLSAKCTGLKPNVVRFTLLRSPLGNKRSKDQFERQEYRSFFKTTTENPAEILSLIDLLKNSSGIKAKIQVQLI